MLKLRNVVLGAAVAATFGMVGATQAALIEVTPVAVADVSSEFDTPQGAIHTIDGSGMSGAGPFATQTHSNGFPDGGGSEFFWHTSGSESPADVFITYDLGQEYDLDSALIWNFNAVFTGGSETGRGYNQYDILVAGDGATPTNLGDFTEIVTDGNLAQGGGTTTEPAQSVNLAGLANGVRYVRIGADSNFGTAGPYTGLSEVRFLAIPEPASIALLGLGGLLMLRRRK